MHKVVINATNIGYELNGIGVYTLSLLRALSRLETDIHFVIYVNKNSEGHFQNFSFPGNFTIRWVTGCISPDYNFKSHFLRLLYTNLLSVRYRNHLIFNTSQIEASLFGSKQIITVHDIIPLLFKKDHKKQYYFYKYLLKYALNKAKAVIVPSNHTKELVVSSYGLSSDKIRVIYNGIQDSYLREVDSYNPKKENFILYIGRIAPSKNIMSILKAFEIIRNKIDHKLIIVGDGKKNFLKRHYTRSLYGDNRVIFKRHISNDEIINLYKNASLFIFPSLYEGFGLPPLEAMVCSCPVVVSNVSSLPEVCGDAAYYVDPYSVESIAEGMYKVLTDEFLRQNLIKKGLERAKLFSWEKSAKEHIRVFEEVLNS